MSPQVGLAVYIDLRQDMYIWDQTSGEAALSIVSFSYRNLDFVKSWLLSTYCGLLCWVLGYCVFQVNKEPDKERRKTNNLFVPIFFCKRLSEIICAANYWFVSICRIQKSPDLVLWNDSWFCFTKHNRQILGRDLWFRNDFLVFILKRRNCFLVGGCTHVYTHKKIVILFRSW